MCQRYCIAIVGCHEYIYFQPETNALYDSRMYWFYDSRLHMTKSFSQTVTALARVWTNEKLLSVSCPSANEFSAILFLFLARSSSNSLRSLEGFRPTLVPNFIQVRQRVKNFPIDPYCKNCPRSATL